MKPGVSVIIPTYNRAYCIERSVRSVLEQSFSDFELIIVDDGSTDNTCEIIAAIGDSRIKYVQNPQNLGAAGARNRGISLAQGNYIAFHDSDDLWLPDKLKKQLDALYAHPECDLCYCSISYNIKDFGYFSIPSPELAAEKKSGDIYAQLLYDNLIGAPALVVKREVLEKNGGFNTSLSALEDYDLALRLAKNHKAVFVDEILVEAEYTPDSVSRQSLNYLNSSCQILAYYKDDYIATDTLNHRLEIILRDAEAMGLSQQYIELLEKIMQL